MADSRLTGLSELTDPARDDVLYIVDDPGGTPASHKAKVQNVIAGPALFVAATDATASEKRNADYVCDGADDDVQILAAIGDLPANGGTVCLSTGTFTIGSSIDYSAAAGVCLAGAGRYATTITGEAAYTGAIVQIGNYGALERCSITIPTTVTANAIQCYDSDNGFILRDVYVTGGSGATPYAISIRNSFSADVANVRLSVGCNGYEIANTNNVNNYGNSSFRHCEVQLTTAGRIGWDIYGIAGAKNYNLVTFNYISAITGSGAGSTGIRIQNCSFLTFVGPDIEGVATSLSIVGGVAGGQNAQCVTVINPYFSHDLSVGANSSNFVVLGGRIYGTITYGATNQDTRFLNTRNNAGTLITDYENRGAAAGVADGGTIAHGLTTTPTVVLVTPTVAGEMASVTAVGAANFTVAIKTHAGAAGTNQTIYWRAWV